MASIKTVLKALYLSCLAFLVVFLLLRIGLSLRARKGTPFLPDYDALISFDPEREGGQLRPDLDLLVTSETSFQAVRFITNSKGFRNSTEFSYEPAERTFRILFLGDSYVDGMRTDQTNTIGYLLENELNESNDGTEYDRYEVMISSHNNPTNAWYYYQRHGRRYQPHLVLLGVTLGNDLTWNSYHGTFEAVKNADGTLSLERTGGTAPDMQKARGLMMPEDAYRQTGPLEVYAVKIERRFRDFLAGRSARFGYEVPPALYPLPSRPGHVFATDFSVSLGLFYSPLMPEIETLYADVEENIRGLSNAVSKTESCFAVVLFPVSLQLHGKEWELLKRLYYLDESRFDLAYPDKRLLDFCRANRISCADILPAFKDVVQRDPGRHLYRSRGDMHFNEYGQETAALVLYEFIRPLLRSGCLTRSAT